MATLVADPIDRTLTLFGEDAEDRHGAEHRDGVGGEPTLDDLVVGAWEGLAAQAAASCPVCEVGTLRPLAAGDEHASGASPVGRCDRCGTTLA